MKRLGILGGTFNPPHYGHIYIAEQAMEQAGLDRVLFIPCGTPPHKAVAGDVSAEDRLEMVRLAISEHKDFELCDIEVKSTEKSYTAKTLKRLKEMYPNCELCFIVGGDSLKDLEGWYHPEVIFQLAEVVAVSRRDLRGNSAQKKAEQYRKKYNAKITVVDIEPVDISSSAIREVIRAGKDVSRFVDPMVLGYINSNKIYEEA